MRLFHPSLVLAVATLMSSAGIVRAGETPEGTTRVEEDWELVIATPDLEGAGPQITTCMAPVPSDTTRFVAFNLNYRADPSFIAGGVHILVWDDNAVVDLSANETGRCNTTNELITWTQRMSLSVGSLSYSIRNGQSTTWGKFGQGNGLQAVDFGTTVDTLALYNPDDSASRSGVGWQRNHVSRMTLLRVRYYAGLTLLSTDEQPRPVVDNTGD